MRDVRVSTGALQSGLPLDRRQRLPEVDRQSTGEDVTVGFLWDFQPSGRLSPAILSEESRWVLRDWRVWSSLQSRGVTNGSQGISAGTTLISVGRQRVNSWRIQDPADFCRKTQAVFGAEVYWKSTEIPAAE